MRPCPHLVDLSDKAGRRLIRLRELVRLRAIPLSDEDDRAFSFVCIEAANLWARYSRSFYLSCAARARDASGVRVAHLTASARTHQDALTVAIHGITPRLLGKSAPWTSRDEPDWRQPAVLDRALFLLGATNLPKVRAAFALPNNVFRDLPTFRNFYAHRGMETANRVRHVARSYALPGDLHPTEILGTRLTGRPQCILADWVDELRQVIDLMPL